MSKIKSNEELLKEKTKDINSAINSVELVEINNFSSSDNKGMNDAKDLMDDLLKEIKRFETYLKKDIQNLIKIGEEIAKTDKELSEK